MQAWAYAPRCNTQDESLGVQRSPAGAEGEHLGSARGRGGTSVLREGLHGMLAARAALGEAAARPCVALLRQAT